MAVDLLSDALGGGIVGVVGSVVGRGIGIFEKKQDHKHQVEVQKLAGSQAVEMAKLGMDQTQLDMFGEQVKGSYEGLSKSIDDQTTLSGKASQWVTDVLALFRPGLTTLLVGLTATLAVMTNDQAVWSDVTFLTATAITWWFGDRQTKQFRK